MNITIAKEDGMIELSKQYKIFSEKHFQLFILQPNTKQMTFPKETFSFETNGALRRLKFPEYVF